MLRFWAAARTRSLPGTMRSGLNITRTLKNLPFPMLADTKRDLTSKKG